MSSFTARVKGHGLVDWTPARIDAYANGLIRTHIPAGGWTPRRSNACRDCRQRWPCPWAMWAEQWGTGLTRSESRGAGHGPTTNAGG